jgi:hypothetical protein
MKPFALGILFLFVFSSNGFGQKVKSDSLKDRDWRIEAEPTSFVFRGYNLHVSRNVTKNNRLNIGLYFLSLDIPQRALPGMFKEVPNDADVRLGFEAAVVARYSFPIGGLNPYVGLIAGWEYFDIIHSSLPGVRISTGVITPFLGHEIYLFRRMIFVNPQLRGVIYFRPDTDPSYRRESMEHFFVLPALSVGVRI